MRNIRRASILLATAFSLCDGDFLMFGQRVVRAYVPVGYLALMLATIIISSAQIWCQYWLVGKGARAASGWGDWARRVGEKLGIVELVEILLDLIGAISDVIRGIRDAILEHPFIKRGGYGALVILGVIPVPGFRWPGMLTCRTANWRSGLWVLVIANAVRILWQFSWFS